MFDYEMTEGNNIYPKNKLHCLTLKLGSGFKRENTESECLDAYKPIKERMLCKNHFFYYSVSTSIKRLGGGGGELNLSISSGHPNNLRDPIYTPLWLGTRKH